MAILKDQEIFLREKYEVEKVSMEGRKKIKSTWNSIKKDASGFVNMFSFFRNEFKEENEMIFFLIKINNNSEQYPSSLNDLNFYVRNNFFYSDLEKSSFDINLFFKVFKKFRNEWFSENNPNLPEDIKKFKIEDKAIVPENFEVVENLEEVEIHHENPVIEKIKEIQEDKISWKDWKNLKKRLKPKKNLSYNLLMKLITQELEKPIKNLTMVNLEARRCYCI
jgi:hypothetical protein